MAGRIINNVKYLRLCNDNILKSKSFEDNVYFTLRDIFINGDIEDALRANDFNALLTNHIYFEDRTDNFKYTNHLHNSKYTNALFSWLNKGIFFEFDELTFDEEEDLDTATFIKLEDWANQFKELLLMLEKRKNELTN